MKAFSLLATLWGFALVGLGTPLLAQVDEVPIDATDREHWSLQPIVRPALPVSESPSVQSPIDLFTQQQLQEQGLELLRPASRSRLLRRVCLDLHGLPPSREQIHAFVHDDRPDAYPRLIEQLLASPAYGERWAQHWLDLARFAETDGFEHDKVRAGAWAYRDWVVEALNQDMSYQAFVTQQLAADLLPEFVASSTPTMFCLAGPDMPDINEQDLRRHDKLNELTSTIGAALLGLQFHCAQCHDHKYDPISQKDFYRLRAIFESAIPEMRRDKHVLTLRKQDRPLTARFFHRGELAGAGEKVAAGFPRLAVPANQSHLCDSQEEPRLAFARWLFDSENPLTARVIANRVWQHHFGTSLCENPSDFGVIAGGPSHPGLLDWLASELRDHDWSLKHLHRKILLSATYQQAGQLERTMPTVDKSHALYHGFPQRRLEGEVLRDSMLFISGELNHKVGGPSVYPPLPPEMVQTLLKGQWKTSPTKSDHYRRSIYIFARRNLRYPVFDAFDRPDAGGSCAMRLESTTPLQSLLLLNSNLTLTTAEQLAKRLLLECPDASEVPASSQRLINELFRIVLAREATDEEQQKLQQILHETRKFDANLVAVCVGLLNCNEFVYVD